MEKNRSFLNINLISQDYNVPPIKKGFFFVFKNSLILENSLFSSIASFRLTCLSIFPQRRRMRVAGVKAGEKKRRRRRTTRTFGACERFTGRNSTRWEGAWLAAMTMDVTSAFVIASFFAFRFSPTSEGSS